MYVHLFSQFLLLELLDKYLYSNSIKKKRKRKLYQLDFYLPFGRIFPQIFITYKSYYHVQSTAEARKRKQ